MEAMYRVNRGVYKGKSGTILQETPRKVRLTLADGKVTGYIPRESLLNPPAFANSSNTPFKPNTAAADAESSADIPSPKTPNQPTLSENNTPAHIPSPTELNPKTPGIPKLEEFDEVKIKPVPAALSEKFDPPIMFSDPTVMAGMAAVAFDLYDGTIEVATYVAIAFFIVFRIAALPARVVMAGPDWLKANWFLVNGCWALHEALTFLAHHHHGHPDAGTDDYTDNYYDMCIVSFGLMPLCFMTYMGLVQCRPERYSSELLTAVFMLLRATMQLTGLLPVSADLTAVVNTVQHLGPYARIAMWTVLIGGYGHLNVACGLSAWRNIRDKFAQGTGW
eukprot:m.217786 g.217786  ORF g.217786 m.217786 type:complete len:335 (+) comp19139_c0_seq4:55-1059(+)